VVCDSLRNGLTKLPSGGFFRPAGEKIHPMGREKSVFCCACSTPNLSTLAEHPYAPHCSEECGVLHYSLIAKQYQLSGIWIPLAADWQVAANPISVVQPTHSCTIECEREGLGEGLLPSPKPHPTCRMHHLENDAGGQIDAQIDVGCAGIYGCGGGAASTHLDSIGQKERAAAIAENTERWCCYISVPSVASVAQAISSRL